MVPISIQPGSEPASDRRKFRHAKVPPSSTPGMSFMGREGASVLYFVVLALFGLGLVLASLWVFCSLSGPDVGACMLDAINPF